MASVRFSSLGLVGYLREESLDLLADVIGLTSRVSGEQEKEDSERAHYSARGRSLDPRFSIRYHFSVSANTPEREHGPALEPDLFLPIMTRGLGHYPSIP